MSETEKLDHTLAAQGIGPLRINIFAVLVNPKTGEVFVGDLLPRDSDLRKYAAVPGVEGGKKKGQTLAEAFADEIEEETGLKKVTLLAAAAQPLVCHFEDWNATPKPRYSGKVFVAAVFAIGPNEPINLDSGKDPEGPTFGRYQFMPLKGAEAYLLDKTRSDLRHTFERETLALAQPVVDALATLRAQGIHEINSRVIHKAIAPEKSGLYIDHIPERLPLPDAAAFAIPASAQRNDPKREPLVEAFVAT